MYYVLQVITGEEEKILNNIGFHVDKKTFNDIFIPVRKRMMKIKGERMEIEEKLFPGYVFVETDNPKEFASEIRKIEGFSKVVGYRNKRLGIITYIPLSQYEETYINKLLRRDTSNKSKELSISHISIDEGKKVTIIDGPLFGLDAVVKKYDLHKRVAIITYPIFGQDIEVEVGIDIIIEKDDKNYLVG